MKSAVLTFLLLHFSTVRCSPCPDGYTQGPNQGACYKIMVFWNEFAGQYSPTPFDQAEYNCESAGAFLASVHSQEENAYIHASIYSADHGCEMRNIGLKCNGKNCRWRDGSSVTYTNFAGAGPIDDGKARCYGIAPSYLDDATWYEKDCTKPQGDPHGQYGDCWVCKKPISCSNGEIALNGGCVSIHTTTLDQQSAEESCQASPGGGHLASIHSSTENSFYTQLARDAGAISTALIGGKFSNGAFEWIDGTDYDDKVEWAKGFPNQALGDCVQLLLDQTFGVTQQWTNVDCSEKQPYICFRSGADFGPTSPPTAPKADSQCPPVQYYEGSGSIYSPNFPLSIPSPGTCEYNLHAKEGTKAVLQFGTFNCQSGCTLTLFDGLDSDTPFIKFTTNSPPPNQTYTATTNSMKIIFTTTGDAAGTGWEAEFTAK